MFGWVRETKALREQGEIAAVLFDAWRELDALKEENEGLTEGAQRLGALLEKALGAMREAVAVSDELDAEIESLTNALHVRNRSIDYLAGEVSAAQEDARAAKALASFWMQSWLSALTAEPQLELDQ